MSLGVPFGLGICLALGLGLGGARADSYPAPPTGDAQTPGRDAELSPADKDARARTVAGVDAEIRRRTGKGSPYMTDHPEANDEFEYEVLRRAIFENFAHFRGEWHVLASALERLRGTYPWIDVGQVEKAFPGMKAMRAAWLDDIVMTYGERGGAEFSEDVEVHPDFLIATKSGRRKALFRVTDRNIATLRQERDMLVSGYDEPERQVMYAAEAVRASLLRPSERRLSDALLTRGSLDPSLFRFRLRQAIFLNAPRLHADPDLLEKVLDNLSTDFPGVKDVRADTLDEFNTVTQIYIGWMNQTVIPAVRKKEQQPPIGPSEPPPGSAPPSPPAPQSTGSSPVPLHPFAGIPNTSSDVPPGSISPDPSPVPLHPSVRITNAPVRLPDVAHVYGQPTANDWPTETYGDSRRLVLDTNQLHQELIRNMNRPRQTTPR